MWKREQRAALTSECMVLQMLDVEGAGEVGMKLVPLFRRDVRSCGRVSLVKLCTLFTVFSFLFRQR